MSVLHVFGQVPMPDGSVLDDVSTIEMDDDREFGASFTVTRRNGELQKVLLPPDDANVWMARVEEARKDWRLPGD